MKHGLPIYSRFLEHLNECDGCTGERNKEKCQFAPVCLHIENLKEKGEIADSKDLLSASDLNNDFEPIPNPEANNRSADSTETANTDPCSYEFNTPSDHR